MFLLDEVMLDAENLEPVLERCFSLGEASCLAHEAADALAQLAAQPVHVVDENLTARDVPEHDLADDRDDLVAALEFFADAVVHAALGEVGRDARAVLLVAVADDCDASFPGREAEPRGEPRVEAVAGVVVPFPDDRTDQEVGLALVREVRVRVADLASFAVRREASRFFFFR